MNPTTNNTRTIVPLEPLLEHTVFWENKAALPVAIGRTGDDGDGLSGTVGAGGQGADPSLKDGEVFSTDGIKELPRIDNRQELERYRFPSLDLLEDYADKQNIVTIEEQQDFINRIRTTLLNFRIKVDNITAMAGPTVTLYKVYPAPGVKLASIRTVESDIGISLGAKGVRVVKLDDAVGIEVANRKLLPTEGHRHLPYIVVVIDEFADLTMSYGFGQEGKAMSRGISTAIIRLALKGRAAGIHLIIATQRPSVSVITGDIKTNFPMRIAFRTASRIDSMTILDSPGSESLIGRGDMLFDAGGETERVQCALVETAEIGRITKFIESQTGYKECYTTPYYLPTPPSRDDGGSAGGPIED